MNATPLTVFATLIARPRAAQPAPARRRPRNPAWFDGAPAAAGTAEAGDAGTIGWYESSAELRRGLAVVECTGFGAFDRARDALRQSAVAEATRPTTVPSSITAIA